MNALSRWYDRQARFWWRARHTHEGDWNHIKISKCDCRDPQAVEPVLEEEGVR